DKQFGHRKENRSLPIVGMGLFMDMDGIPISFSIYPGNRNEQLTMIPLEKKMLENFDRSKFIVCTDAGLSSATNRVFNSYDGEDDMRGYITTQPIKTLKGFLQEWCMADDGWALDGDSSKKKYKISELDEERDKDKIFFKTRWIKEEGIVHTDRGDKKQIIEQKLIVSYSIKYKNFQRRIREGQIERAMRLVESGEKTINKKKQNAPKRFIKSDHATRDGEVAEKSVNYIDESITSDEEKYDGFYAVCTNLDDSVSSIVKANKRRWEIEECFRIMKTDFEARPVYLSRQDRILAHFITCFIALIVYRYLEKKLGDNYTVDQILPTLQEMDFMKYEGKGYQPVYTRTELTDALHEAFGFCTSKQIVPVAKMRNIISQTKH
ncbi:MAG: IS1634 family transposase, partial [Lachnospiraceae bacterium]|nr:IS1634 family transposase [Lachnospiraceae bacterium]